MTRERWAILALSTALSTLTSLWFADYRYRSGWAEGFHAGVKYGAASESSTTLGTVAQR